ncbi:DoxX family protein (plasmid) [Deinococcus psychrotolerans]|uniref:DoxX family protein n=1 Tax=Deinococcus psychrotolerans TaxID=2489213 RepID=A0A3G8YIY0_9DEIO|nr:DoxX family protein [Deinococcus psychrotolerans]AZI44875.1 DoxX family protein [Deinococcus psychrotolerans]
MTTPRLQRASPGLLREPNVSRLLFADPRLAPIWALLRIYVGYEWLMAGWEKITNPAGVWVGEKAGTAVGGFLTGALAKTGGAHPDVQGWYAWFLQHVALPNAATFSYLVAYGEVLVGAALIVGLFTGIAAFFGGVMNASYLLAGTISTNPLLFILATWLVLGWRVAGWWGLDRWVLALFGVRATPPAAEGPSAAEPATVR